MLNRRFTLTALLAFACLAFVALAGVHEGPDVIDPLGWGVIPGTPIEWTITAVNGELTVEFRDTVWQDYWRAGADPTTIHDDLDPIRQRPARGRGEREQFGTPTRLGASTTWAWSRYSVMMAGGGECTGDPEYSFQETSCASDHCSSTYMECLDCAQLKLINRMTDGDTVGGLLPTRDPNEVSMTLGAALAEWSSEVNACYEKR